MAGKPPRLCLARSGDGTVWRFRADLSSAEVRALARYAGREGPLPPDHRPPERQESLLRILWPGDTRPEHPISRYGIARDGAALGAEDPERILGDVFDYA